MCVFLCSWARFLTLAVFLFLFPRVSYEAVWRLHLPNNQGFFGPLLYTCFAAVVRNTPFPLHLSHEELIFTASSTSPFFLLSPPLAIYLLFPLHFWFFYPQLSVSFCVGGFFLLLSYMLLYF